MNILFFIGSFFPAQDGGPNNSIYWIAKHLKNNKNVKNVDVLTFYKGLSPKNIKKYNINPNKFSTIDGINIIYFKYYFFRILSPHLLYYIFFKLKKYNFAHLNSVFFFPNLLFSLSLILNKIPYCISLRGELENGAIIYKKKIKIFYIKLFARFFLEKSKFIHITSKKEKSQAKHFLKSEKKFILLPNIIDIPTINKVKLNKKNLLYLGRIHPKKNLETVISSFSQVSKSIHYKIKFIIVGTGDLKYINKLKNYAKKLKIEDRIIFTGFKDQFKKLYYFKNAKYLILASHSENFGNVILEAISNSTPVIVSDNLPWKIIKEYNLGFYFKIKELNQILVEAFNIDHKKYIRMFRLRNKFLNNFSAERNIHQYYEIYSKYSK